MNLFKQLVNSWKRGTLRGNTTWAVLFVQNREISHVEASVGRVSLCSESVAIGTAATAGDAEIEQIVAVTESGNIVPPVGCAEN